ncbi:isoform 2 of disease resistance protein rpp8 [Fagus crenata]
MAETVVSPLIDKLISLLTQEAELLSGIDGEVADIKDELESIQSFLKDADARAAAEEDMSEGVKTWVKQLREVALCIDVFIDKYLLQMAQHHPQRHGLSGFLYKSARFIKMLKPHHEIATEVQEIKASLQKIKERSERYRFQTIDHQSMVAQNGFEDTHIHSLLLFNLDELPKSYMSTFFVDFKLLKSLVSDIPVEIKKLRKLRHLIAYYRNNKLDFSLAWEKGVKIEKGIECLKYLQKLYHVELNHGGVDLIKELGKLRQLRKLAHFVSPSMSSTPPHKVPFREVAGMDSTTSTSSQNKNILVKVE